MLCVSQSAFKALVLGAQEFACTIIGSRVERELESDNVWPVKDRGIHRVDIGMLGRAPLRSTRTPRTLPRPSWDGRTSGGRKMVPSSFTVGT